MPLHVALLRGINVGGHKRVPMAELRALAEELGWEDVRTVIQSGNVLFRAGGGRARLEQDLEAAIEGRFGFPVPVLVRPAREWHEHASGSPFPDAEAERPKLLHLGFAKGTLPRDVAARIQAHGRGGERVVVRDRALWIDYPSGVARSKLTPAILDREVGSTVTLRNLHTVRTIAERLAEG